MNVRRMLFVGALLAAGTGCKKPDAEEKPAAATDTVPTVTLSPEDVIVAKRGEIQTGPRVSGTLEASQRAVVRAESNGTVLAIGPELGQSVKRGDLLAKIEAKALGDTASSAQAGVMSAQAQLELARKEVQRTEALVKGGAVAQRELDRAQGQLSAAQAGVAQARGTLASSRSMLGDATVKSPIAGVVARRSVNVGDVVAPGAELYDVIDPKTMRLDASVSSEDLSTLTVGKEVAFAVRGYRDQKFVGKISRIAPAADPVTRQIQVLVEIPNEGNKLVAGLYAEGRVAVERREALTLPFGAVDTSGDQPTVLRVKDGIVERVPIAVGLRDERAEVLEVTSGVNLGDVLLLSRATKNVGPGSKVSVPGQAAAAEQPRAGAGSGSAVTAPTASGSATAASAPVGTGSAVAAPVEQR